jgi:DNA-binding transcriptional ArsR family regulator
LSRSASLLILSFFILPVFAGGPSVKLVGSFSHQFVQEMQKRVVLSDSGPVVAIGNASWSDNFLIADSVFLEKHGLKPAGWIETNSTRIIPAKSGIREFFMRKGRVAVYSAHGEELYFIERGIPAVFSTNGITVISIDMTSWQDFDPEGAADFLSYVISLVVPNPIPVVVVAAASIASASYILKEQQEKLFKVISLVPLAIIKIKGKSALENRRRVEIIEVLTRSAGMSISDVSKALGISKTAASWHLSILERSGLVMKAKIGNMTVYYCGEGWQKALLFGNRRKIVEHLMKNGPKGIREIAEELGISTETAKRNVDLLQSLGIVESRKEGRKRVIALSNKFVRDFLTL